MGNYNQLEARVIALCYKTVENRHKLPASYNENGVLKYDPTGEMWVILKTIKDAVRFIQYSNN